jgi:hypothetical protein
MNEEKAGCSAPGLFLFLARGRIANFFHGLQLAGSRIQTRYAWILFCRSERVGSGQPVPGLAG